MAFRFLAVHESLSEASRLRRLVQSGPSVSTVEMAALVVAGCGAALLSSVDLPDLVGAATGFYPRIPGYTIVRTFLPMSLGLALVPRRLAATMIGATALVTALALNQTGMANIGNAAICSLAVTGPLLDVALWSAQSGWRLYAGFVIAGVASNSIAYIVHGVSKFRTGHQGGMIFADWEWRAAITYPICGAVVCLVCALMWFRYLRSVRSASIPAPA